MEYPVSVSINTILWLSLRGEGRGRIHPIGSIGAIGDMDGPGSGESKSKENSHEMIIALRQWIGPDYAIEEEGGDAIASDGAVTYLAVTYRAASDGAGP